MAISQYELDSFNQFAAGKMTDPNITLDEVWHLWRIENPTDDEHAENVAAVNAAIDDYKNGDRGRPAGELTQELRKRLASDGDEV